MNYRKNTTTLAEDQFLECSICFGLMNNVGFLSSKAQNSQSDDSNSNEEIKKTNASFCNHSFCPSCIQDWIKTHPNSPTCPICRSEIIGSFESPIVKELMDQRNLQKTKINELQKDFIESQRDREAERKVHQKRIQELENENLLLKTKINSIISILSSPNQINTISPSQHSEVPFITISPTVSNRSFLDLTSTVDPSSSFSSTTSSSSSTSSFSSFSLPSPSSLTTNNSISSERDLIDTQNMNSKGILLSQARIPKWTFSKRPSKNQLTSTVV